MSNSCVHLPPLSHARADRNASLRMRAPAAGSKYGPRCIVVNGLACGGGGRGHNVVALHPDTGALLLAGATFDT